jgi:D-alanine-D-alanine ligase
MPGNLKIAVLYEPSDNTGGPAVDTDRVHHKERRGTGRRRRWRGAERRYKHDRKHVLEALRANGRDASLYELGDEPSLLALSKTKADLIFNMAEAYAGDDSREAHIAAFLDLLELRYTGAGPQGLFLAQDKALAKKIYVIEANPNPWLAPEAELAIAAALTGRGYVELIGQIVGMALARYAA